jgi:LacI family transcriptional regulator
MGKKQRVRLIDIAQATGLTVNSVSRALRNGSNISPATRARVHKVADELGYIPNQQAQSLRNVRFQVIGVVYDNIINPYYSIVTGNIDALLSERNYRPMVFFENNIESILSIQTAKEIISFGVSGVISFLTTTKQVAELLEANGIPLVILGRNGNDLGVDSVLSNDYRGGKLAGYHLFDSGGKNFAYLGARHDLPINQLRLQGFNKALTNNGAIVKHTVNNDKNETVAALLDRLFKADRTIDSIFCFNDLMAFEVVNYLLLHNKKVPEDINVIGYDNLQREIHYPFRLTTIDNDKEITAKIAIDLIFEKLNNPNNKEITCKIIDVALVAGQTTTKH